MELLAATQNQGKLKEITAILKPLAINVLTPQDVGLAEFDVEETGDTFAANAILKARVFAEKSGYQTLADDSGLGVASLDGRPGVHSKRIGQTDAERIAWVLNQLPEGVDRTAWFISVLALYNPTTGMVQTFEGKVMGKIAAAPAGDPESGFGYDPIFIPDGYSETFAELGQETKNTLSHRARALAEFKQYITDNS